MAEKDKLVSQHGKQIDTYHAKASDFSVKKVSAGHGQSSDAPGEKDELVKMSHNQESPRDVEDSDRGGSGKAEDSMKDKASSVASNFKVSKTPSDGTSLSIPESIDLESGKIESKGYGKTRADEVPDKHVHIG